MTELEKYTKAFSTLHTAKVKGQKAPHKAILLLAIISLVEKGNIASSHIELSEELVECFYETWVRYVGKTSAFTPDIAKPFFHMQHESFWKLVEYEDACTMMVAEDSPWMNEAKVKKSLPKGTYSLKAMRQTFAYAEIAEPLFLLLQHSDARIMLRSTLLNIYLKNMPADSITRLLSVIMALSYVFIVA